jgi:integrase
VAVAGFTGLRRGELKGLEVENYKTGVLTVRRSMWRKSVGEPKGKRGKGVVPVIPWLEKILESYIRNTNPRKYLFEGVQGGPINLEHIIGSVIVPALTNQPVRWCGWHAFRRGLATNLHQLGIADIVIQAILWHSNVAVTRDSYIISDMLWTHRALLQCRLWKRDYATTMQLRSLDVRISSLQRVQNKVVPPSGEMAEWLKAAVC